MNLEGTGFAFGVLMIGGPVDRILKSITRYFSHAFRVSLFIIGVLGAIASADRAAAPENDAKPLFSMVHDMRIAQEANDLNNNTWNLEVANINEEGLTKIEDLLSKSDSVQRP